MLGFKIFSGWAKKTPLLISDEGAASVVVHPHPPVSETRFSLPFRSYFKTVGNSSDMLVDGSTVPVEFLICASALYDTYIKTASVAIIDAQATLNKFGNLTALTNGIDLTWVTGEFGAVNIATEITTNFDFIRLALGEPSFGDGAGAFRGSNVFGSSEGYLPVLDFAKLFGLPWGLRLRKGTNECLKFTIRDNISTMDQMDIIGFGTQI